MKKGLIKYRLKQLISKGVAVALLATIMPGITPTTIYGAPANSPGRIALDIGTDFQHSDSTGDGSKELESKSNGQEYELTCYTRLFSDHDKDGVTYRTVDKYDMTDVTGVAFSAYTKTEAAATHTFMVYTDSRTKQVYNGWSHSDVTEKNIENQGSDGAVYNYPNLSPSNLHEKDPFKHLSFNLKRSYDQKYLYFGVSNKSGFNAWSTSGITLNNRTYINKDSRDGCFAFLLKEHKVGVIAPEKITVTTKSDITTPTTKEEKDKVHNGEMHEIAPALNIEFHGNNSDQVAGAGDSKTISLYRGDPLVLTYTSNIDGLILKGYNLYSDKDGKNLIYTINWRDLPINADGSVSSMIEFDAELIQNIEKKVGSYNLGDFYIQPVFEPKQVVIIGTQYASNSDQQVGMKALSGYSAPYNDIPREESHDWDFVLFDKTNHNDWIGIFHLNKPKYMGDELIIDYKENPNYDGLFELYRCNILGGDDYDVLTLKSYFYRNDTAEVDYSAPIQDYYLQINPQMKAMAKLTLKDDTDNVFDGNEQTIEPAILTYPLSNTTPGGKDKITYTYYKDEACTQKVTDITKGPINAGTYYVVATMPGDDNYAESKSNMAKFVIQPAKPEVTARGSQITYGYSLGKSTITGTAKSSNTNQTITGTYEWVEPDKKLDVGYYYEKVKFTPDSSWGNYSSVIVDVSMSVKAASVEILCEDQDLIYSGEPAVIEGARATYKDEDGNVLDTNQEIRFSYYTNSNYSDRYRLDSAPTEVGTYWVKASVSSGGNFNGATKKDIKLTIKPEEVSASDPANVSITLVDKEVTYNGQTRGGEAAILKGPLGELVPTMISYTYYNNMEDAENGMNPREDMPKDIGTYYMRVTSAATRNYEAASAISKLNIRPASISVSIPDKICTYSGESMAYKDTDATIQGTIVKINENNQEEVEPVTGDISYSYTDESGKEVKNPVNAGKYTVTVKVSADGNYAAGEAQATLVIQKKEAKLVIDGEKKQLFGDEYTVIIKTYDGNHVEIPFSFTDSDGNTPDPKEAGVQFELRHYNSNETEISQEIPKDAGFYFGRASIGEDSNYQATCSDTVIIWIKKADVEVVIPKQDAFSYTGERVQIDSAAVTSDGEDITKESEILYLYYADQENKMLIKPPKDPGTYYLKAYVKKQDNYKEAWSEAVEITINEKDKNTGNLNDGKQDEDNNEDKESENGGNEKKPANDSNDTKTKEAGSQINKTVKTGDNTVIAAYVIILLLSGTAMVVLLRRKRRSR